MPDDEVPARTEAEPRPADKPAKAPAAKKTAPRKTAPTKAAPAKAAPAKDAPAKAAPTKDAAKKTATKARPAPAPVARGAAAPRESILNRIHELEQRIASETPGTTPPPVTRPTRPQRVARPVRPEASTPPTPEPLPAADPAPAVTPAPVPEAVPEAVPEPTPEPLAKPTPEPEPRTAKPAPVAAPAASERADRSAVRGNRLLVTLIVVLLAAAAGLGAAAAVKSRQPIWRAESVVTLLPPPAPTKSTDAIPVGLLRYRDAAQTGSFTQLSAFTAGLKPSLVRHLLEARTQGGNRIVLTARATRGPEATALAGSAARNLVLRIVSDQALTEPSVGDRLSAAANPDVSAPVMEQPTDGQTWLAGVLAGLAVLLVGLILSLLGRGSPRR